MNRDQPHRWGLQPEGQGKCAGCRLLTRYRYRLLGTPVCIACLEDLAVILETLLETSHPRAEEDGNDQGTG